MLLNQDSARGHQKAWKRTNCPAKSFRGSLLLFSRLIRTYDLKVVFVNKDSFMLIGRFNDNCHTRLHLGFSY